MPEPGYAWPQLAIDVLLQVGWTALENAVHLECCQRQLLEGSRRYMLLLSEESGASVLIDAAEDGVLNLLVGF